MSGDSLPFPLPLSHLASGACEATALYGELRKPLLRYLVCLGLSVDEAQDVVQEAFLSLHRHLTAGGSKENIRSWLFRVAHNRARNQQTRYDRRFGAPLDAGADSPSGEATPEQAVLEKEEIRAARQGHQAARGFGTSLRSAARRRIALSRNWRGLGHADFHGGGDARSDDQETSGEMQCVTFRRV